MKTKNAKEYDKKYAAKPDQLKNRAQRNAARRIYEKAHGDLPSTMEVNHKVPIDKGGTNALSNLEAVPAKKNRGWRKGRSGYTP